MQNIYSYHKFRKSDGTIQIIRNGASVNPLRKENKAEANTKQIKNA